MANVIGERRPEAGHVEGPAATRAAATVDAPAVDAPAVDALYRRYEARVRRLALRLVDDRATAEDVTQEAFVRVLRNIDRFDAGRPAWPWLRTIVTNLAIDHARANWRVAVRDPDDAAMPDEGYARSEDRRALTEAMARVPTRQRAALAVRYLEDWDTKDAAEFLGVSVAALDQLLFRARARLRAEYDRIGGGALGGTILGPVVGRVRRVHAWLQDAMAQVGTPAAAALTAAIANLAIAAAVVAFAGSATTTGMVTATSAAAAKDPAGLAAGLAASSPLVPVAGANVRVSTSGGDPTSPGAHPKLVAAGATTGLSHTPENRETLNTQAWVRVGGLDPSYGGSPTLYCDSKVRQKLCDAAEQLPPLPGTVGWSPG